MRSRLGEALRRHQETHLALNRKEYYRALSLPLDAERFIANLQAEMRDVLSTFDTGLKRNPYVRLSNKSGGWVTLTPLDVQRDPPNLIALKAELNKIWPMTSLLDIVKETHLRPGWIRGPPPRT